MKNAQFIVNAALAGLFGSGFGYLIGSEGAPGWVEIASSVHLAALLLIVFTIKDKK